MTDDLYILVVVDRNGNKLRWETFPGEEGAERVHREAAKHEAKGEQSTIIGVRR